MTRVRTGTQCSEDSNDGGVNLTTVLANGNDGGGEQVKNIADPTEDQDAATKKFVTDQIAEDQHYRGLYVSLVALQAAVPAGNPGDYADVDAGVGTDIQRYIWDDSDDDWILGGGSGQAAQISFTPASGISATNVQAAIVEVVSDLTAVADAKVADAINDGTTGVAPSQNAVFDALALKMQALNPTAVQTSNYNAVANEMVPVDTTSGSVTVTFPTAPADKTLIAIKHVIRGGTNTVGLTLGGSDKFNTSTGATSGTLTLANQAILCQYKATGAIWYVIADDLSLAQLDLRFQALLVSGTNIKTVNSNSLLGSGDISVATLLGYTPSRRILYLANASATGLTGTTNETLLDSYLIAGGTVAANDWIEVTMTFTRSGATANLTNRLRVHTANQISGSTVIANAWTMNTGQFMQQARRTIRMKNSVSSQEAFPSAAVQENDLSVTGSTILTMSQNFANDQYIIVTSQLTNGSDTLILRSWMIELIRQ